MWARSFHRCTWIPFIFRETHMSSLSLVSIKFPFTLTPNHIQFPLRSNFPHSDQPIGNNMNMYLGSFLIFFGLMITRDLHRYYGIYEKLLSIDKDFNDVLGLTVQLRNVERIQFRFEMIALSTLSAAFIGISTYDLNIMYPP